MSVLELREKIPFDVFGAMELNACLRNYANKAQKISSFLRHGEIIQVRRGLYVFPAPLRHGLLSNGVLANRIYGPSYVSEDFALSFYSLIPDMPRMVTSIAMGRSRLFHTPFGDFAYRYCRSRAYSIGLTAAGEGAGRFLIATPEKAIFDKALYDHRFDGSDPQSYLEEDLRIEQDDLKSLNHDIWKALEPFMVGHLRNLWQYVATL